MISFLFDSEYGILYQLEVFEWIAVELSVIIGLAKSSARMLHLGHMRHSNRTSELRKIRKGHQLVVKLTNYHQYLKT